MQAQNMPLIKLEMDEGWKTGSADNGAMQVVEVEVLPPVDINDKRKVEIYKGISEIDEKLNAIADRVAELNGEIDSLTNHADGIDYAVAVASGILTGLIDSIFVGEIDIKSATEETEKKIADKVKEKALKEKQEEVIKKAVEGAKKKGKKLSKEQIDGIKESVKKKFNSDPNHISETGKDPVLKRAIKYLEDNHPTPQDNLYKGTGSSPATHHLDDIAHHASLAGMIASIVVQFLRVATFVNSDGKWQLKFVKTDAKELAELWAPVAISGLLNWLVCIAEKNIQTEEGEKLPEPIIKIAHLLASTPSIIQVIKAIDNWCLHLYSDIAGSSSSKGRGAGIPGLFISLLKEISCVPPLNFTGLPKAVEYLYSTQKIDLRTEMGIVNELGRQAVPVIINEVLVRTFYFVRHLVSEYKKNGSFADINWQNVIPFGNRTVERMMTIASGTFVAVDVADAAIRSGGFNASCILRLNFVGIGRFAIAIGVDVGMGVKKGIKENKRLDLVSQQLQLMNVKVSYQQAGMWVSAKDAGETINEAYQMVVPAVETIATKLAETDEKVDNIVATLGQETEEDAMLEAFLSMYDEGQGEV